MDAASVLVSLTDPRRAARELPRSQPFLGAMAVALLAPVSESIGSLLLVRASTGATSGVGFLAWNTLLGWVGLVLSVIAAAVFLPVGARLVGGEGSTEDFTWCLVFSFSPYLFWTPVALFGQLTPIAILIYWMIVAVMVAWTLWIQVSSLGVCFRIGTLRALFATMLGYGLGATLAITCVFFDSISFFHAIAVWKP